MGFFDELKKMISGNVTDDQPDSSTSEPLQQISHDQYWEAEGWATIQEGQIWKKGRIFCFIERISPPRQMVCQFGPHTGEVLNIPAKTRFGFSGIDPRKEVQIEYLNFEKQRKTFTAILGSLQKKEGSRYISTIVLPKKIRINLNTEKIVNPDTLPPIPSPREKRKIASHLKRGTTNPAYEALRSRFPVFAPLLPTSQEKRVMTFHENRESTSATLESLKVKYGLANGNGAASTRTTGPSLGHDKLAESADTNLAKPETVNIIITGCEGSNHDATKVLQELKQDSSYFEILELLRDFPNVAFENISRKEAEGIEDRLEATGCTVEMEESVP